ncbi:MAG: acetate--CoA ligase family protein, partial [Clostridia bacterium]|nr:acetate--CoA ligase family protein [Clostridia bacterium]
VAPLSRRDAEEMIREIKGHPVLAGVRGRPAADLEALTQVLLQVSELAVDLKGVVKELDINPLMVFPRGQGAKAADALMVLSPNFDTWSGKPAQRKVSG